MCLRLMSTVFSTGGWKADGGQTLQWTTARPSL